MLHLTRLWGPQIQIDKQNIYNQGAVRRKINKDYILIFNLTALTLTADSAQRWEWGIGRVGTR